MCRKTPAAASKTPEFAFSTLLFRKTERGQSNAKAHGAEVNYQTADADSRTINTKSENCCMNADIDSIRCR